MRLSKWRLAVSGVLLLCLAIWLAQCNRANDNHAANGPRVVHVPHRFLPGLKKAPEMDAVFRDLRPGKEVKLKVVFSDPSDGLLTPNPLKINRGSVYFCSKEGYFRLNSEGNVYSSPDGQHEVDLNSHVQEIKISYCTLSNTKSSGELELSDIEQAIEWEEADGKYIGYVVVKLSQDFEGDVTGWKSFRGK